METFDAKVRDLNEQILRIIRQYLQIDSQFAASPTKTLTEQELRLVEHLGRGGPRIMSELASFLGVAVNTTTAVVDHLERKHIVRRQREEEDRRKVSVHLTDFGQDVYQSYLNEHLRMSQYFLSTLNPDEQASFLSLIRKICRGLEAYPNAPHLEN